MLIVYAKQFIHQQTFIKAADDVSGDLQAVFSKGCISFISLYVNFFFSIQIQQEYKYTKYDHLMYDLTVLLFWA